MGVVYGGIDPELGRRVAIKLVRWSHGEGPGRYTTRLRREALALARLSHPNIVALYDIGSAPRGVFMAMEFLRGQNLRRWLRTGPRSHREILRVMLEAGRGLSAAHAAGIVHRDLKPTNVMVCDDGRVKVLDFGLARGTPRSDPWLEEADDSLLCRKLTRADVVVGTAGYMAPEQLLGGDVGPWSDQFSFCVTLFEALYGHRPYPGRNPVEAARAFHDKQLVEPSRRHRRHVPPRLHQAVMRGLSLDPADRFPDMDALLEVIEHSLQRRWRTVAGVAALISTAWLSAILTLWITRDNPTGAAAMCIDRTALEAPAHRPDR